VRVGRRLRWPDNYCKAFLSYRLENTRYFDFSDTYHDENGETIIDSHGNRRYVPYESSLQTFNEEWMLTSAVSLTIERDSRDLPTFATSGSRIFYTGEVCGGMLGGRWDYFRHLFHVSKYYPLIWGAAIVGKAQFGYVSAHSNDDIPYSERFSPGGVDTDGTVRGYKDASLSPRSTTGAILGGMSEAVYNLELQMPIIKGQIYLLAFADAGNSWVSKKDIKPFSDLYHGAGFGFRMVVPSVGVIGFDFGYALDKIADQSKGWRPHFQVSAGY
jgi:outer membrane protein insertion porin family